MGHLMALPQELTLRAGDGTALHVEDWPADAPQAQAGPAGCVVLMHGLGEHCGRYAHVAKFFNERGWTVRAYDHRGHGKSEGPRGDVPDSEALVRDAAIVIDDFMRRRPGRDGEAPLLLGHSMGGLFAARYAAAGLSPLRGLVLSSPALALPLSGVQKGLLKALAAVAPGLGVDNGLKTQFLSHDPAVAAAYEKDPLVHPKISSRLLRAMLDAIDFAHTHAPRLTVPTLLAVAADDRLVDARGSDAFYARLAPGIGTLRRYDGYYHEIFNETGAQRVFADLHAWLEKLP
jgi:alpha-beta hydrolase superfamily lysophospholipase